jgi:hypothetical protein
MNHVVSCYVEWDQFSQDRSIKAELERPRQVTVGMQKESCRLVVDANIRLSEKIEREANREGCAKVIEVS